MLKVYAGGILMVLGMFAVFAQPMIGAVMIGGGYLLYSKSTAVQRHDATSLFFGFCLLCGILLGVSALLGLI